VKYGEEKDGKRPCNSADWPGLRIIGWTGGAAQSLAHAFGLSVEQFMRLPFHSAYTDTAMPAEHAALATAYLVVKLGEEYHGDTADGYTILERAGFIKPATSSSVGQSPPDRVDFSQGPGFQPALEFLGTILEEIGVEFGRLPVFFRPMARAGFKNKSGCSLPDWITWLEGLLAQAKASQQPGAALQVPEQSLPANLAGELDKLSKYYREVPAEMGRFTRDPEMLQQMAQIVEKRVAAIQALQQALPAGG
jgi:hypothetical protein